ncbi:hypothetical protein [Flavobacterium gelatinilyticum]|uniref:hypothetical protein n=1 Tax=Flavobacterium gelatinilyticum TaxID=3003260 RepID=UPI0024804263|nr:hypothetical protein [Flavobacterium gelatinilyticum]
MKKIGFFLLSCLTVLVSCNNDDEKSFENKLVLPKSIIYKSVNGSYETVTNLFFDGNKILEINSINKRNEYLYEGDKIVKEIKYSSESGGEVKISETSFTYENDKLIVADKILKDSRFKYLYIHNENGTITREEYSIDNNTGKELKTKTYEILTFTEGNLTKTESHYEYDAITFTKTLLYTYDTSNSAFKNVLGVKYLLDEGSFDGIGIFSPVNNLSGVSHYTTYQFDYINYDYANGIKYEYNREGYPTKKISFTGDGTGEITEYKY